MGQDGLVLIPIEHLSREGLSEEFQALLVERTCLTRDWIAFFNQAFALYWKRALDLHERAPQQWMPPRAQHLCVYTVGEGINPYSQLFHRSSWSLLACDFEPSTSSLEYATYQFFQAERANLLRQLLPALIANLPYFLTLTADQLADFKGGCGRSQRGDAAGYRALARAVDWVSQAYHEALKPPSLHLPGYIMIPYADLIMPMAREEQLNELQEAWAGAAQGVIDGHFAFHSQPSPAGGRDVADWLRATRPMLLIAGREGRILWDPERPDAVEELLAHLEGVTASAEARLLADLALVERHTQRFFNALRDPSALADPAPFMTPGGLSYVHPTRKRMTYSLHDEGNRFRLREPAPPFERLMLAARTVHEWGHLAAESGWIGVPEAGKAYFDTCRAALVAWLEALHAGAPAPVRAATSMEVEQLRASSKSGHPFRLLVKLMLTRSEDYQANMLAQRFLSPAEMETYIRNNVYSLVTESDTTGLYARMLRYAYQYQYLRFSRVADPLTFFLRSTWFAEQYFRHGILTEAQFQELLALVGDLCGCYRIDESKFDFTLLEPA